MIQQGIFNPHFEGVVLRGGVQNPGSRAPVWGQVTKTNADWTANVRAFTGETYFRVPYPAGGILAQGEAHGRVGGLLDGMRVKIEFIGGTTAVIGAIYPHFGKQKDRGNIELFKDRDLAGESPQDFADYHQSGYRVKYGKKKIVIWKNQTEFITVDMEEDEVYIEAKLFVKGDVIANYDGTPISLVHHLTATAPLGPVVEPSPGVSE